MLLNKSVKLPKLLVNSFTGIFSSIISIVSLYITRISISYYLGEEIYGVNSIFASIVSTLLILELGMSTAMIIIMYQPIVNNDREKIRNILFFYKKFYWKFCCFLFITGIFILLFLLKYFINTTISIINLQFYFGIYLLSIIFKYLWSYKSCLLYADKKNSVISRITIVVTLLFLMIELIVIIGFKMYSIYLIVYLLQNVTQNAICNVYVNKNYSYIKEKNVNELSKEDKTRINQIIKPMFVQRMTNQIQDSSSLVIMGYTGASAIIVGHFSNYILVVHACQQLFSQITASFTTSYGNYCARNKGSFEVFDYYLTARFCMSWISAVFSTLYLCLIETFIILFFGSEYCMETNLSFALSLYVFVVLNNSISISTQNALGLHFVDKKYMILQCVLSLLLSYILGTKFGPIGIIIGTLIPTIIFSSVIKGKKVTNYIYNYNENKHIKLFMKEICIYICVSIICYSFYTIILKPNSIIDFTISAIIIFLLSNILMLLTCIFGERKEQIKKLKNLLYH